MQTFETALGDAYLLRRRLPRLGWRPGVRSIDGLDGSDALDAVDGDLGVLAVIGIFLLALVLVALVLPLLLFVAEVALVIALIVPLTVFALVLGVKRHAVELSRADGTVLDVRPARGVLGSIRASRELRRAAAEGASRGPAPAQPGAAPIANP